VAPTTLAPDKQIEDEIEDMLSSIDQVVEEVNEEEESLQTISDDEIEIPESSPKPDKNFTTRLEKATTITEFGLQEYSYLPILDPDKSETGYFSCHTRDISNKEKSENWKTAAAVLSKRYKVVNLEKIINVIRADTELINKENLKREGFLLSWHGEIEGTFKVFDSREASIIFSILTGHEPKDFEKATTTAKLAITNSYHGKKSLTADFILDNMVLIKKKQMNVPDFFTLLHKSSRAIHAGSLIDDVNSEITKIQEYINDCKRMLKGHRDNIDQFMEKIQAKLGKKDRSNIIDLWEAVPSDHKNMFLALLIISYVLGNNYSIETHAQIRPIVSSEINKLYKKSM
jgi:hypothetical protein